MTDNPFEGLEDDELDIDTEVYEKVINRMVAAFGAPQNPDYSAAALEKLRYRWLNLFLNQESPETFMNASASARACGFPSTSDMGLNSFGYRCRRHFKNIIGRWLDEEGISESYVKGKVMQLMEAEDQVGTVQVEQPDGTLKEQPVYKRNHNTQFQATKLMSQIKGMLVDKHVHSGDPANPIRHDHSVSPEIAEKLKEIYKDGV